MSGMYEFSFPVYELKLKMSNFANSHIQSWGVSYPISLRGKIDTILCITYSKSNNQIILFNHRFE